MKRNYRIIVFLFLFAFSFSTVGWSQSTQSVKELDEAAEKYYKERDFNQAMKMWLTILIMEPDNIKIQQKIERLYLEKQRKDLAKQLALNYYYKANSNYEDNFEVCKIQAKKSLFNLKIAYQIDPRDKDLDKIRLDLKALMIEIQNETRKRELAEKLEMEYSQLLANAKNLMKLKQFDQALILWKKILRYVPRDSEALEGKRKAEMAIANRIRYEKIDSFVKKGDSLFLQKEYQKSLSMYEQVLELDKRHRYAIKQKRKIEYIFLQKKQLESRRLQAEQFYNSGIRNIKRNKFDEAQDDLENVLVLIPKYKDTEALLKSLDDLRLKYAEKLKKDKILVIDREFQKGLIALNNEQYQEALISFKNILDLDPNNNLAKKYQRNALDALLEEENEVVHRDSPYYNVIAPLIESGKILYQKGNYLAARENFEKVLVIFPKNRISLEYLLKCDMKIKPERYLELTKKMLADGKKYLRQKKYTKALKKFEMIKSIDKNYPRIDQYIADAKRIRKAASQPKADPSKIEYHYNKGMGYYQTGGEQNIRKALKEFQWVAKNDPRNNKALININKIEAQLNIGSQITAKKKSNLSKEERLLARQHYLTGMSYYSNNEFEKAIMSWRKTLAIDPSNVKAKNNIKKCLVLLGK